MNARNYSKETEQLIDRVRREDRVPRLLLHSCCAPCSSYCLEYLREAFAVTVFFYNPNITETEEYEKRKAEEIRLIEAYNAQVEHSNFEGMHSTKQAHKIEYIEAPYDPEAFLQMAKGQEEVPEGGSRCMGCYALRLAKTAAKAKEGNYDFFTTTLTISPLKNAAKLNEIGEAMGAKYETAFLPSDFKKKDGYKRSIELSSRFSLYRQNYCGCIYSKRENRKGGKNVIKLIDRITMEMGTFFEAAGYDRALGRVGVSNRPDLCEYQCNGAMAGAKQYHKAPLAIATEVAEKAAQENSELFASCEAVAPGFLNIKIADEYLAKFLTEMAEDETLGSTKSEAPKTIILDYGGPNVAKPLHVGHLRSASIGEAIKRILRFHGDKVISDIHLGDWGLQMGLIITELEKRQPELCYFDKDYQGEYPQKAPFTVSELEEIYPFASKKSKEDADYYATAMDYTNRLQKGERGLRALWKQIVSVSVADMKRNYKNLDVDFDLWLGESDVHETIPPMVEKLKEEGYAYESNGALVVDVAKEDDAKEIPPCIILKSDGASLYTTTDLATIVERMSNYHPDEIIYVTDKRQELHFVQVFRAAKKCQLVGEETLLRHIGFGTMNGKDGKPFKTREGGVMRLQQLLADIDGEMLGKIQTNPQITTSEAEEIAQTVALAAVKYGDLSNQAAKDYIFDIERFTSFEGDTGPYILYTIVRIKSILKKYEEESGRKAAELPFHAACSEQEKNLMLCLSRFGAAMDGAYEDLAPHKLCAYIYELSNAFNSFYHSTKIISETDESKKEGFVRLLALTEEVLLTAIHTLGFDAPERM